MSLPTEVTDGRQSRSVFGSWYRRTPPDLRLPLDGSLDNHALPTMPKAPARILAEYERRGSPAVTPAVVSEVAAALNLHPRTVERVLYNLPPSPRPAAAPVPETTTMPPLNAAAAPDAAPAAAARPLAMALLPAAPPAWWFANLSWDTVRDLAAEVDRLTVDLRYGVPKGARAQMASALGIQPQSIGTYATALRKACGIEFISVHKPEATAATPEPVAATPAPPAHPAVETPPTPEPVAVAGEPPVGLAPEHQAVWCAWVAAGYSPTEYVGWHDKERLAIGLQTAAGKVHQAQRAWLELLGLPFPKAPDQQGAKGRAPAVQQGAAPPETVRENQAPVAEPVDAPLAPEILPDGGHIAHVPQPPTCQHCAGLGVVDGCPDCGAVDKTEPESVNPGSANPEWVCLRCKDQSADYCAACIRAEKSELGKRFSRLASMVEGAHRVLNDLGVPTDADGPLTLAERIRAYDRAPSIPADWMPTAANINALPDPLRSYIHDLEIRCDPARDTQELALLRENCRALEADRNECLKLFRRAGMGTEFPCLAPGVAMLTDGQRTARDLGLEWKRQKDDADADHRECIRLLSEAGADTSGETMALNLVQLIEERDDALAELQRLREEAETQHARSQEQWQKLNRYELALMPCLQRHQNGEPEKTPLPDRLVTALQATLAELEQRKPDVHAHAAATAELRRLQREEVGLAGLIAAHTVRRTLLEELEDCPLATARLAAVLHGAGEVVAMLAALEGDGGQG